MLKTLTIERMEYGKPQQNNQPPILLRMKYNATDAETSKMFADYLIT